MAPRKTKQNESNAAQAVSADTVSTEQSAAAATKPAFADRVKPNRPSGHNIVSNPGKGYRIDQVPMIVIRFQQEPSEEYRGAIEGQGFTRLGDGPEWAIPANEKSHDSAMQLNNEFSGQNLPYWQPGTDRGRG